MRGRIGPTTIAATRGLGEQPAQREPGHRDAALDGERLERARAPSNTRSSRRNDA